MSDKMLIVKLREAMLDYRRRHGKRMTYEILATATGIRRSTLGNAGSILGYHPTLGNIEKICIALDVKIADLLEIIPDPPKRKPAKKKRAKKKAKRA